MSIKIIILTLIIGFAIGVFTVEHKIVGNINLNRKISEFCIDNK